jgi:hypothetical protein
MVLMGVGIAAGAGATAAVPATAGTPIAQRPECPHSYLYWLDGADRADFRDALLCLINGARKAQGLPALKRSEPLETVAQAQTTANGHGKTLTEITKRFARKGYKAAAYNEGFAWLRPGASPYAFLYDMTRRAGVPCTQVFDPRFRDIGIGIRTIDGGLTASVAIEVGRRVGTSQPSSNTKPMATCGHRVPKPLVDGPLIEGKGTPAVTATGVTVQLTCTAPLACALTASAQLDPGSSGGAKAPAQELTIPAGKTQAVTFPFAATAGAKTIAVALTLTAPAEYRDTLTAPLGAYSPT